MNSSTRLTLGPADPDGAASRLPTGRMLRRSACENCAHAMIVVGGRRRAQVQRQGTVGHRLLLARHQRLVEPVGVDQGAKEGRDQFCTHLSEYFPDIGAAGFRGRIRHVEGQRRGPAIGLLDLEAEPARRVAADLGATGCTRAMATSDLPPCRQRRTPEKVAAGAIPSSSGRRRCSSPSCRSGRRRPRPGPSRSSCWPAGRPGR